MRVHLTVFPIALALLAGLTTATADADDVWLARGVCRQCQEDGGSAHHYCGTTECESGGENCFDGCDHIFGVPGSCFANHDHCGWFLSGGEISKAIANADVERLRDLLHEQSASLKYNESRHAIQVFDCEGNVTDHLPVGPTLASALTD